MLPLPLVIAANVAVGKRWAGEATFILAGGSAATTFIFGVLDLAEAGITGSGSAAHNSLGLDLGIMSTGVIAASLAAKPVRERVSRIVPLDPDNPVHAFALVLAVILFGTQVSSILFTNVFAADQAGAPLTVFDLLAQEAPFLILAAAGVGLYIRRSAAGTAERLGLVVPRWWHVALALAATGVFFVFGQLMAGLSHAWSPTVAHQVATTTQHIFGGLGNPLGIAAIALAPGICEELLFRGALQPRLGLLPAAMLFTSIHTQYGVSLDAVSIFAIAIGLGLIRKYTNTTTSCISHISYNLLAGIGIGSDLLGIAAAFEVGLIVLVVYVIWSRRHRAPQPVGRS